MNFDDLEVIELLEFTNKHIQLGLSVGQIGQLFEPVVKEDRIRKKLNKNGYKRVKHNDKIKTIFERQDVGQGVGQLVSNRVLSEVKKKNKGEDVQNNSVGQCRANVGQLDFIEEIEKVNFIELMRNFNTIMEIVNHYNTTKNIESGEIIIHLPHEDDKKYKASLRVNKLILDEFKKFCNNHKQFSQKDLLSMAMLEYMKNHS